MRLHALASRHSRFLWTFEAKTAVACVRWVSCTALFASVNVRRLEVFDQAVHILLILLLGFGASSLVRHGTCSITLFWCFESSVRGDEIGSVISITQLVALRRVIDCNWLVSVHVLAT